ncbi:MAG: hypothetical protein WAX57_03700, partial [Minisyncoccia bacterium]
MNRGFVNIAFIVIAVGIFAGVGGYVFFYPNTMPADTPTDTIAQFTLEKKQPTSIPVTKTKPTNITSE